MKHLQGENGYITTRPDNRIMGPSPVNKPIDVNSMLNSFPQRYIIKSSSDERFLTCLEAPNISIRVEAGLTIASSSAHKSPPGTIYLDGVAQCEPFMDPEKLIYNFDHHQGCLRPFTLSTCEQVLVILLKGLDLRSKDWKVFTSEPDLDTMLAIWLILNHSRISRKDNDSLEFLYALVRLEGIIDSHGLEMTRLSAFPLDLLKKTQKVIDHLRVEEVHLKKTSMWEQTDYLEYAASTLHKIDKIVYKWDDLADFRALRELARVKITENRIAVVVEAEIGIYELESQLKRVYGKRLGMVVLKKGSGSYTLRRLDPFMPGDLNDVYERLNYIDPVVRCRKNGHRWGGSSDIGGSPRGIDTKLSPEKIAQICGEAFWKPNITSHAIHFFYAIAVVLAVMGVATFSNFYLSSKSWLTDTAAASLLLKTNFSFFIALLLSTTLCLFIFSRHRLWRFGIRVPNGNRWWIALPLVMLTAIPNGIYLPGRAFLVLSFNQAIICAMVIVPLASELLFRSLVHGILAQGTHVESCNSRWVFSYPSVGSAFLYAGFIAYLLLFLNISQGALEISLILKCSFAAFAFGLTTGFVREKSQSIFPTILFHTAAISVFAVLTSLIIP